MTFSATHYNLEARATAELSEHWSIPDVYILNRIKVGNEEMRGMGFGSQLLKQVCHDADKHGVTLQLYINAYGPLDHDDLEAWYMRYGFRYISRGLLERPPHSLILAVHEGYPR